MQVYLRTSRLVTKDQFKGDSTFIIKKEIVLFVLLHTRKGLLYLYVSDFL